MMRNFFPLVVAAAAIAVPASGQQPPGTWHITNLDLDVGVTPATRMLRVAGTIRLELSGGGSSGPTLAFGPGGVTFDSVRVSVPAAFTYSPGRDSLLIRLAAPATSGAELTVSFHAHTDRDIGRNLIRPEGAMISWGALWYPVIAWQRDSVPNIEFPGTTRITVPERWRTLSPGTLVDSSVAGGSRTEVWRVERPIARSFVAAEFVPAWVRVDSSLVAVYLLPRHANRRSEYAEAIPRMVRTLSSFFGSYPYTTFGIAELPRSVAPPGFGGRSEPGYFIAHTDALDGEGVNVGLFAHELAHMWFPNAVDSRPPGDDAMDEAIADYGVAVYREVTESRRSARHQLIEEWPEYSVRGYFHHARAGLDEPLMADYGYRIARAKGPVVYDMLRRRVGDSVFFGVWRDLAARGGSASLSDLRRLYIERAPRDTGLATFLSQWMDRKGAPEIHVTPETGGRVRLDQAGAIYELDVPVRVQRGRSVRDTVLHVSRASQSFALGHGARIELDPADDLLLWKPRFGPPPSAPASWSETRWRNWMRDEVQWLMRGYEVKSVSVNVIRDGRVLWTETYGSDPPSALAARDSLLTGLSIQRDSAFFRRQIAADDVVALALGRPRERVGVVVTARGGWGGRQLTLHVAQRVAIQYRWGEVPR